MIVHVAFLGFKPECWTPCPEAPDWEATPAHKWVMGDTDKHVWCMWCKAVAWCYRPVSSHCEHQRAVLGPPCPQCPCHHPDGHTWHTDAAAPGVEHCRRCQSARAIPGMVIVPGLPQLPDIPMPTFPTIPGIPGIPGTTGEIIHTGGTTTTGDGVKMTGGTTTGKRWDEP